MVTLSPRVGEVITAPARNRFQIFRNFEGFVSAVIFESDNNTFFAKVAFNDKYGAVRDTIFRCPLPLLVNMADKINHYEALRQGTYKIGQEPTILTAGGRAFVMREVSGDVRYSANGTDSSASK